MVGVLIPAALAFYSVRGMLREEIYLPGGRGRPRGMMVYGEDAVILGLAYLSLAMLAHCYFAWPSVSRLYELSKLGVGISLLSFVIFKGWFLIRFAIGFY